VTRTRILFAGVSAALAAMSWLSAGSMAAGNPPQGGITAVAPTTAFAGEAITVSGNDLEGTEAVTFGNVTATPLAVDPGGTWVKVDVPSGVQLGSTMVVLIVNGTHYSAGTIMIQSGSMSPQALTTTTAAAPGAPAKLVVAPKIVLFSPAAAKVGSKVTIYGQNFVNVTWVKLGGKSAKFHVVSKTRLWLTVPLTAKTGKLAVRAAGGTGLSTKAFKVVRKATQV